MKTWIGNLFALAVLAVFGFAPAGCSSDEEPRRLAAVTGEIRATLENASDLRPDDAEQRRAWDATVELYRQRDFAPFWVDGSGPLPRTGELLASLRQGDVHGLSLRDYDFPRLEALRAQAEHEIEIGSDNAPARLADLDLVYSYTFLSHAIHLTQGRVVPAELGAEWHTEPRSIDMAELLPETPGGVENALQRLVPHHPQYSRLLAARERYRQIVERGGWPEIPQGPMPEVGASGPQVAALRIRLAAEGDLADTAGEELDEALVEALKRFQARHGLEPDGKLGDATRAALAVSAAERLRTLELNLERWRWTSGDFGDRYVAVNIPDFRMWVQEGDERPLEMRVIVGKRMNRTPVFSDTMTHLVLNPSWYVPESISEAEILPQIREDPGYARRKGYEITRVTEDGGTVVDPSEVTGDSATQASDDTPWWSFARRDEDDGERDRSSETAQYRVRQLPGPANSLGEIKFMFPNEHNIYLHDTPADSLFDRTNRDFSHGCVRIERPLDFARYLLRESEDWSPERIEEALAGGAEQRVDLPEPLPVHLLYWTAWVDGDGTVHFREDLYGHDQRLARALKKEPPVSLDLARIHEMRRVAHRDGENPRVASGG